MFFALAALPALGLALAFTLQGFWPILPFAGLELAALAIALRVSLGRRGQQQVILLSE